MNYKVTKKNNFLYNVEAKNKNEAMEKVCKKEDYKIEKIEAQFPCSFHGFWQRDRLWGQLTLGDSNSKVKDYGCTMCSIMSLGAWYCSSWTPTSGAKKFRYTKQGYLIWQSVTEADFPMDFVWRYYSYDKDKIREILFSESNSVIVQVNNGAHWCAVVGYSVRKGFKVYDPWYNDVVYIFDRYPNITGFTEFKKSN